MIKFIKPEHNFTIIPNEVLHDSTLSWRAKGLYAFLAGLPQGWTVHKSYLTTKATDGLRSLKAAIRELKTRGYLKIYRERDESTGKIKSWVYELTYPPPPATQNPVGTSRHRWRSASGAQRSQLSNTYSINTISYQNVGLIAGQNEKKPAWKQKLEGISCHKCNDTGWVYKGNTVTKCSHKKT